MPSLIHHFVSGFENINLNLKKLFYCLHCSSFKSQDLNVLRCSIWFIYIEIIHTPEGKRHWMCCVH